MSSPTTSKKESSSTSSNTTTKSSASPSTSANWDTAYKAKVLSRFDLPSWRADLRNSGKTLATLNGSFDLLHAGHLHILCEASKQADVLLLALNTDASIRSYKGPKRPLVSLEDRLKMVCALSFVDYATTFDEPNPIPLLEIVQPDVHVNGSEYGEACIESDTIGAYGGRLHIVPLIPGLSTTKIIEKIQCA